MWIPLIHGIIFKFQNSGFFYGRVYCDECRVGITYSLEETNDIFKVLYKYQWKVRESKVFCAVCKNGNKKGK